MHQSSELVPPPGANAPPACGWPKRYSERSFIARQHTTTSAAPDATAALACAIVATDAAPPPGMRVVKARSRIPRQRIRPISSLGSSVKVMRPSMSAGATPASSHAAFTASAASWSSLRPERLENSVAPMPAIAVSRTDLLLRSPAARCAGRGRSACAERSTLAAS
jgi:hypothetical protein